MPARLIIESDIDSSRQEISFDRPRITIGRKPGNDLHFNRPEISGTHAAFLLENDNYYVTDLGSTNGTLLNGAPIVAKEKYPLNPMDVVTIAPYRFRFEGEPGATIMEAFPPPEAVSLRRPSGTEPNLGQRTGTAEHEKEPVAAAPAPPPAAEPAPDPSPVEEAAPEPPKEKAEAPKIEENLDAAAPVEVKEKGGYEIYIWLAFGAVFVLLAIGLIVLLIGL